MPFELAELTRYARCYRKEQFTISGGYAFTLNGTLKINRVIDPSTPKYINCNANGIRAGITECVVFQWRDCLYNAPQAGEHCDLSYAVSRVYRWVPTVGKQSKSCSSQ